MLLSIEIKSRTSWLRTRGDIHTLHLQRDLLVLNFSEKLSVAQALVCVVGRSVDLLIIVPNVNSFNK